MKLIATAITSKISITKLIRNRPSSPRTRAGPMQSYGKPRGVPDRVHQNARNAENAIREFSTGPAQALFSTKISARSRPGIPLINGRGAPAQAVETAPTRRGDGE